MEFVLGLPESLGLRRPLLLEVGLFRVQLGLELLQRLRLLGEFDRFLRGSFSNASRWSLSNACSDCKVVCQVRLSSAAFASSPRNRAASSSSSVARLERSAFRASRSL